MIYEPYDDPKYEEYAELTEADADYRKSAIKNVDYRISIALLKGIFVINNKIKENILEDVRKLKWN